MSGTVVGVRFAGQGQGEGASARGGARGAPPGALAALQASTDSKPASGAIAPSRRAALPHRTLTPLPPPAVAAYGARLPLMLSVKLHPPRLRRCDEQILPAVYAWVGASFKATPTQLGAITLGRAMMQALSSPLGGIAGAV